MSAQYVKRVLFSPIGDTDPIKDGYDGAMLHIVRHYKPEVVILYLTQEMVEKDEQDNRYELFIKKLQPGCKVIKIKRDITEAHNFDIFVDDFNEIINNIFKEYPEHEVLLNISSGTPQIKSNLSLITVTSTQTLRAVQVASPRGGSSKGIMPLIDFDLEKDFDNLLDNLDGAANRCTEPKLMVFRKVLLKSQLASLIANYDYDGAATLLKSDGRASEILSVEVVDLIEHARLRFAMLTSEAKKIIETYNGEDLFPIKQKTVLDCSEYLCIMDIKQKKGEISDFVLRISPLMTDVAMEFVTGKLGFEVSRAVTVDRSQVPKIDPRKIEKINIDLYNYLNSKYNNGFALAPLSLDNIIGIAEYLVMANGVNEQLRTTLEKLVMIRNAEKAVRNVTAHEIESITDEFLMKRCGKDSKALLKEIETVLKLVFSEAASRYTQVYDILNEQIISAMNK